MCLSVILHRWIRRTERTGKKVREAVALAQQLRPDLKIDGEFQADAAVDARVGEKKVKRESAVAGHANVLIFPDAAGCNIGSKLVQRLANMCRCMDQFIRDSACRFLTVPEVIQMSKLYNNIALLAVMAGK